MSIRVRQATIDDLPIYVQLQKMRWQSENQVTLKNLKIRLNAHPEGMLVAEENSAIVGMVFAMRINEYDEEHPASWYDVTQNGTCRGHEPDGQIVFGVDLTTAPRVGARAGDALLAGIAQMVIRNNIEWCMLGGRMPGYYRYKHRMTPEQYLWKKNKKGQFIDKQVRFYASNPGLRVIKSIPHYFHDPESDDNGVLLKWRNPFYGWPLPRLWARIFPLLLKIENIYQLYRRKK